MLIKSSGMTDVGLQRERNEDSFSVQDTVGLYMVADGMGGHLAGEVASRVAVEIINKSFGKWSEIQAPPDEIFGFPDESLSREGNYILGSIRLANRVIYEMASEYEQYNGMGTTIVSLLVGSGRIVAANVGDSRMYLVRDNRIERMSKDHTIVAEHVEMGVMTEEEAARSPLRHILTRNLGSSENVDAEVFEIEPSSEDLFIMCSDGLTDLATDEEILRIALKESDSQRLTRRLIDLALERGAPDNTTVVSVFLDQVEKRRVTSLGRLGSLVADALTGANRIKRKLGL
ncbi:MAG: Stp1/IreP family PP2C-type Ser/Thr phosphatase [Deltaproteobacteria bacterium]|nr:Stp1/IreP family PP2C-type Ser/Thr phosphatase [Deltaproteobacteria bacterium]NTV57389.1 Stp1/IreP family PP2C-type Ser/Thr phosphatase [Deltaproteobacteria bacterium]